MFSPIKKCSNLILIGTSIYVLSSQVQRLFVTKVNNITDKQSGKLICKSSVIIRFETHVTDSFI